MPNGRLMVNCGGVDGASDVRDGTAHPKNTSSDDSWLQNSTIKALSKAFPGQVGPVCLLDTLVVMRFPACNI